MLAVVSAFSLVLPKLHCKFSGGLPLLKPLLSKPTHLLSYLQWSACLYLPMEMKEVHELKIVHVRIFNVRFCK